MVYRPWSSIPPMPSILPCHPLHPWSSTPPMHFMLPCRPQRPDRCMLPCRPPHPDHHGQGRSCCPWHPCSICVARVGRVCRLTWHDGHAAGVVICGRAKTSAPPQGSSPGLWAAFTAAPTEGFSPARRALHAPAMDQLSFRPFVWHGRVIHASASKDKPRRPPTAFADGPQA
jgi:hypothetical protein